MGGPSGRDRTLAIKSRKNARKSAFFVNDGNNNGQLRITNATSGGSRKAAWAKIIFKAALFTFQSILLVIIEQVLTVQRQ